jgi:hypothetical protein
VKVAVPGSCRRLKTWALDLHGRVLSQLGYGLRVEAGRPFVREVFPELAAELVALLEWILRLVRATVPLGGEPRFRCW